MRVTVTVDKEKGEIRIADTGIGMTDEEVRRYINQVAFFQRGREFPEELSRGKRVKKKPTSSAISVWDSIPIIHGASDRVEIDTLELSARCQARPLGKRPTA